MDLIFGDKDMRFLVFLGIAVFLITGFLWGPLTQISRFPKYSTANAQANENPKTLKKIDWNDISPKIGNYMTQSYGKTNFAAVHGGLRNSWHNGIDISASYGAPILSESEGKVVYVGDQDNYCRNKGYGKFVVIKNSKNNYTLLYAHLSKITASKGQKVDKGETIGYVGETGFATGPHLHFSIFKTSLMKITEDKSCGPKPSGGEINPLDYLRQ